MARMSRNKGKRGEREIINMLQPIVDAECERAHVDTIVLQRNLLQADRGGCDMYGLEWLSLEVKRREQLSVDSWWKQTLAQAYEHQTPILLYRGNHAQWKCRLRANVVVGGGLMTAIMDVSLGTFLAYFRARLRSELSSTQKTGMVSPVHRTINEPARRQGKTYAGERERLRAQVERDNLYLFPEPSAARRPATRVPKPWE